MGAYTDGKELVKDIVALAKGISDMDLKNKILDLQSLFYDLNDENRELRLKLHELENSKINDSELTFREGVYTKDEEVFCGVCWDDKRKLVRVRSFGENDYDGSAVFICEVCNKRRFSDIPYAEK